MPRGALPTAGPGRRVGSSPSSGSGAMDRERVVRHPVVTALVCAAIGAAALAVYVTGAAPSKGGFAGESPPTVPVDPALPADRYDSQSSASTPEGAAWEFTEGLSVRITGAHRLGSAEGTRTR